MAAKRPLSPPQVPEALCCPITYALFRDPVTNSLGNTYERTALLRAWEGPPGARRDPLTNETVPDTRLVPNQDKRRQVRQGETGAVALRVR
jgi:STIP1 family protein 1